MTYTIVIPVLNQLKFTQQCVDSLRVGGVPPADILVINNGSTDGTADWLGAQTDLQVIHNAVNLGCGGAWAQGAFQSKADWVVLLNNDVIVPPGHMDALFAAADRHGLGVVSPSLVEGAQDYDLAEFAPRFVREMSGIVRTGWFHGVSFAIRRSVLESIGYPDTDRRLGGHEDKEYLVRCLNENVKVGTVGDAVLHHFGSITQKALKEDNSNKPLGDRHYSYRRMGMGWLQRKRFRSQLKNLLAGYAKQELAQHGMTLHMEREGGAWSYR